MPNRFDFSLIIPTLNERDNIESLLAAVIEACRVRLLLPEILVADGGSSDGTVETVSARFPTEVVRVIRAASPRGLAGDVLAAAEAANCEVVAVMDADFSHPPEALPDLLAPVLAGQCDIALGSRYCRNARVSDWPWMRRLISRLGTWIALPLVGINDPLSGFFAVRRDTLLRLGGQVRGFKLALEVLARSDDCLRVREIPIHFRDRRAGRSKLGWRESLRTLGQVMELAGGSVRRASAVRFALVGLLGVGVDLAVFRGMAAAGYGIDVAYLAGFLVATVCNYLLNSRWSFRNLPGRGWRVELPVYSRYLLSCVFALIMREAVFNAFADGAGWGMTVAGLAGIAAGAGVNYIGAAFFVFPQPSQRSVPAIRWRSLALAFLLYSVALRLFTAGGIDLIPEEAYYWNYAQRLAPGYLDHPPMVAWMIAVGTALLGDTEIGVRAGVLVLWVVAGGFAFALTRQQYGRNAGIFALMLVATLPGFFGFGLLATPDAPVFAAWSGALYFLYRALVEQRERAWYGVGLFVGLGMLSKYTIVLLGPAALAYLLLARDARFWLRRPQPYLAVLLALALFSPVIYWNATHDWASFWFQGARRWSGSVEFGADELALHIMILLTPMLALVTPVLLWPQARSDARHRFAYCFTLVPLAVFVLYSMQGEPKLNWTGPLWLAFVPWLAAGIACPGFHRFQDLARGVWQAAAVCSLLLWGGLVSTSGAAWSPDRDLSLPVAWEEFAASVADLEDTWATDAHGPVRLVGMDKYFISSELAFYDPHHDSLSEVTGQHLFGADSLMWRWWAPCAAVRGRDLLLIAFEWDELVKDDLTSYVAELGPIRSREVRKNGRIVARYFYRLGHGYRGHAAHGAGDTAPLARAPITMFRDISSHLEGAG
ncbi:dolichyl-phosphate beta-D-mannosyltransferase [Salinisphaera sp. PC39]